ncbi:hypothetical protein SAMN02745121_08101 [Nannocystis exedens]|uniref:Dickkopf N-terminal cysteine-rich domain-containing protein n=1 Tax=Nannocystis exedens TaxID=54 RepID=A0A1I2HQ80_9BACT|nr:hypothetical protein [Nannocystis exedens]PCC69381.1 hypothetical protein NAEX_02403 [Nannocystis exedens]SFF31480.1 hypothetical protein SAMN02745121_08101 [Nannocystis exedens]
MRKTSSGLVLWFGAAAAGCAQSATPENFAGEYEEALCAWSSGCSVFQSRGQCRDALVWDTSGRFQYLLAALEADRVTFDAEAAEACLEQVSALACEADLLDRVLFSVGPAAAPEVCREVFVGKVRNYDPCLNSEECAGDAVCGFPPGGCPEGMCCAGACRVLDTGAGPKIGDPCNGSDCEDDAFCARDPNTFLFTVCTARREAGEGCSDDTGSCAEGLYCDFNNFTCKKEVERGGDCSSGETCAEGLRCYHDGDDGRTCRALPNEGESCSPSNYPPCARFDNYCDASNRCVKKPGPGEACPDWECLPYAECQPNAGAQVCILRGSEGSSCGADTGYIQCIGHLQCGEGDRCAPPDPEPVCDVPE